MGCAIESTMQYFSTVHVVILYHFNIYTFYSDTGRIKFLGLLTVNLSGNNCDPLYFCTCLKYWFKVCMLFQILMGIYFHVLIESFLKQPFLFSMYRGHQRCPVYIHSGLVVQPVSNPSGKPTPSCNPACASPFLHPSYLYLIKFIVLYLWVFFNIIFVK